jgi:signal transduction histidine kinase
MSDARFEQNGRLPAEVPSRAALEMRKNSMFSTGSRTHGEVDVMDDPRPSDGAWRVWEQLRMWDQRFAIVVDATVAVGLFVVCSGWFAFAKVSPSDFWFVAGLTLPLVLRRRAPISVFVAIAIVALVQWTTTTPLVADSALLVALYTVTAECDWIAVVVAALTVEIGVILATEHWTPVGNYSKSLIFLTGMALAALFAGVLVRALRSQMDWLAERAHRLEIERDQQTFLAAAAERARIAREMHDVVSHNIQVMVTLADAAAVAQRSDPRRATEAMNDVSGTGRQALKDMRRLLGLLRSGEQQPEAMGMAHIQAESEPLAPQPGLAELNGLAERVRSTGLRVSLEKLGDPFALSDAAQLTVFRIVQEALTNALKHADSVHSVNISLTFTDPEVTVVVVDDGRSSLTGTPSAVPGRGQRGHGGGHGVLGMAERAAAFDGSLVAGPRSEGGWQVAVTLRGCKAPAFL